MIFESGCIKFIS